MSTILQAKSAKPCDRELGLWDKSAKPGDGVQGLQTVSGKDGVAREQSQTATGKDDYDERILLMQRAFNEIAKICYWNDYNLDADDWELLDAARLDELPYDELRAALVHAYKQIKRKAVQVTNHTQIRR
jgi:hypothetical protein